MEGGTVFLVSRGIDSYAVPVSVLRQHLETTDIHVELANRPIKFVVAYLSYIRPLT
jgi:hypothetical protein